MKKTAVQSAFLTPRVLIGVTFGAFVLLLSIAVTLHFGENAFAAPKQPQNQPQVSALERESSTGFDDLKAESSTPTLGDYTDQPVSLSGNTTITPSAAPANTTSINVSTNTNFKGTFVANPATGVVRVTDAHPFGTHHVTVTAFGPGGTTTKSFNLTVSSNPCEAVSGFDNAAFVSVGSDPRGIAIGDFNGDGRQDFAVPNWANGTGTKVSIRLGNGSGGFSSATDVNVGHAPISVAIGDFNGDGNQDLAVANDGASSVSIRLGNGSGGFTTSTTVSVGPHPLSIAVGDFNGDGKQDFATANHDSNNVSVRLGDGLGGFGNTADVSVGDSPFEVAIGDFNGDGKQDLAVANSNSNSVSIRLGDGLGGFHGTTEVSVGPSTFSLAIGDFNGDGKQDLAAPSNSSNKVFIRLGDGLGGFSGSTEVSVGTGPYGVAIGDFNGDGNQDLAVATFFAGAVSIVLGDGLGGFNAPTEVGVGGGAETLAVGDFNGDGRQDLAVAGSGVSIRLGNCIVAPTPTPCADCTPTPTPKPACATFSNSTPIILPFDSPSPYPSNITVSGIGGAITNVTVALNHLSHPSPDSIDVLLVGPGGQYATILSDVGAHIAVSGIDLVLDDNAPNSLPDHSSLVSGVFRPTNFDRPACIFGGSVIDPFPAPAPYVSSTESALSTFTGSNPNGIWSLYVVSYGGEGSLATGWSMTITTDNCGGPTPTPPPTPTPGATYLFVNAPSYISAFESFQFTVTARDRFNNTVTDYAGTIHFTTSDLNGGSLPPDSGLTNGTGTFTVTFPFYGAAHAIPEKPLKIPWSSAITATDTIHPSITGTSNCINTIFPSPCPSCNTPTPTPPAPTPTPCPACTPTATPCPVCTPTPTPGGVAQAVNLSTRLLVGTENNVGIGGFIITGTGPRQILLRGIGPSLGNAGIPNALSDPMLELHGPPGFNTVINNNWRDTQETPIAKTGIAPADDLESAILATVDPGGYTAILKANNSGLGVGLVEIYDLSPGSASKLSNLSTRAFASTGSEVVIAGFILGGGTNDDTVLLRGLGPSLIASGVPNTLANPTLEVRNNDGAVVAMNDDWQNGSAVSLPPSDPLESAIETTLSPGAYTALLSGVNNGTGVGLVEIYDEGVSAP